MRMRAADESRINGQVAGSSVVVRSRYPSFGVTKPIDHRSRRRGQMVNGAYQSDDRLIVIPIVPAITYEGCGPHGLWEADVARFRHFQHLNS